MTSTATTAADLEGQIAAIDSRRREIAGEQAAIRQAQARTQATSPAINARIEELGRESAQLMHHDRIKAQQELARLRQREQRRRALMASLVVTAEHRELCRRMADLAGELVYVLQAEQEMHQQLAAEVGSSALQQPCTDDTLLERIGLLAERAAIIARARPEAPRPAAAPTQEAGA